MHRKSYVKLSRQAKHKRLKMTNSSIEEGGDGNKNVSTTPNLDMDDLGNTSSQIHNIPTPEFPTSDHVTDDIFYSSDESDETDFEGTWTESESLKDQLRNWAVSFNINHIALTALLAILQLHTCFKHLPSDARTLLKTPRKICVVPVQPGHYAHIGLEVCIKKLWKFIKGTPHIDLLINIDGLPLFKSSSNELWPILGSICNVPILKSVVFPIGVYCGKGKPFNCSDYLKAFIEEVTNLATEGIVENGQKITLAIKGFICDAPAKSFILSTKGHTGYSSCTKCTQRGVWDHHRMTFPENDAPKRTHEGFLTKADEDFHSGDTPLISVPGIDFIHSFPLDYMHLVCLGVVRTIMYLWIFGPIPLKFPSNIISDISHNLISIKQDMPIEFNRKPRSLNDIRRWKATEFRHFLLYTGPVVLKNVFKGAYKPIYEHFLSLSISLSFLLNPTTCSDANYKYANSLLVHFVNSVKTLYGPQYITHNMHGLIHLAESIEYFGCLDLSSAFPFENFLQFFKRVVRKGDKPLEQVMKRCGEIMSTDFLFKPKSNFVTAPSTSKPHFQGPLLSSSDSSKQFSSVKFSNYVLTSSHPDSCCLLKNGSIVVIQNIVYSNNLKEMSILCKEFSNKSSFFGPQFINSQDLNIFHVSNLSVRLIEKPLSDVVGKMVLLPYNSEKVAFQLIHTSF